VVTKIVAVKFSYIYICKLLLKPVLIRAAGLFRFRINFSNYESFIRFLGLSGLEIGQQFHPQ
jgi:hypothetical protein